MAVHKKVRDLKKKARDYGPQAHSTMETRDGKNQSSHSPWKHTVASLKTQGRY